MAGKKYKMPRRSEFRSQSAYERARAARIRQIRKKRRRLRALVKSAIIAVMVLVAGALCMGLFFWCDKIVFRAWLRRQKRPGVYFSRAL